MRRRRKPGVALAVDDESGLVHPIDEMVTRWDGAFVHKSNDEQRHPQEFVRAGKDPYPVENARPRQAIGAYCPSPFTILANGKILYHNTGPAAHLVDYGVGGAEVGCTFYVWPDS